jgi:tripartite-type tricarboxylate transporter receptor subunit TctC
MEQIRALMEGERKTVKSSLLAVGIGLLFFSMTFAGGFAFGQEKYPSRAINLVIGLPAGSTTDMCTRALAGTASKVLGQPIVVLNKPGAATVVAIAGLKKEKGDGYTIGSLSTAAVFNQHLRSVPYDIIKDFTPIMQYGVYRYGLVVNADSPWKTLKEFLDYAKANPGKIRYSVIGPGSPQHLVMERLGTKENIKWQAIPFEGDQQVIAALLGGHVEAASEAGGGKVHVQSGRLRFLAVYDAQRNPDFPDVPTLKDLGFDISPITIIGLIGPKGIPPQVVETLHLAFKKAMEDPDFVKMAYRGNITPFYRSPQETGEYLASINEEIATLVKTLGLRKKE